MKAIFLGKDKPKALEALRYLVQAGVEVKLVVGKPKLEVLAKELGLRCATENELYDVLPSIGKVDLVLSYLFWRKIKAPLIDAATIGCLNFHPAPLPDFRGLGGYNVAIYEKLPEWGVSAHFVDETFDTGDVIEVRRFAIDADHETAFSLEGRSQQQLLEQFKDVVDAVLKGNQLSRKPQAGGKSRYITREEFEQLRKISPTDTAADVDRKIRAFWYPPFGGAAVMVNGREFTLVNEALLSDIARCYGGV